MIAFPIMLLAGQAITPCTTAGLPRLGGGAVLVRPVTSSSPVPFVALGPTTSIRVKRDGVTQVGASADPVAEALTPQCEAIVSIA